MPVPVTVTTPSDREIVVTRRFNAPAQLIWDAHTKPELVKRWLFGPDGWTMPECEIDLSVGGAYRYLWRAADGSHEFGSRGVHREIDAPHRLVTTEKMDGFDGEAVNTMTLAEEGGVTTLTIAMLFPTTEIRDAALQSGMADGMGAGYDRLEAIMADQAA